MGPTYKQDKVPGCYAAGNGPGPTGHTHIRTSQYRTAKLPEKFDPQVEPV